MEGRIMENTLSRKANKPQASVKAAREIKPAEKAAFKNVMPTVNVKFNLPDLGAKRVLLSGDFNDWSLRATPMNRQADGHWETTLALAPGRYQYKFVVDGQWIPDPNAHEQVNNQHGTLNSVVEVRA